MRRLIAVLVLLAGVASAQIGIQVQNNGTPVGTPVNTTFWGGAFKLDIVNGGCAWNDTTKTMECTFAGSPAFSGLTPGTNTNGAMVVGNGSSLATTGTGTIDATTLGTHAASYFQTALGYTPLNPANNLTDVANAATALSSLGGQAKLGAAPTTVSMGGANGTKALVYVNTTPPLNLSKTYFDGTDWQIAPSSLTPNAQTGDYAILGMDNASPDLGKVITSSKATAAAWTLAQAGTGSPVKFPSGFFFWVKSIGAGTVTITATTSKFLITDTTGASTLVIPPGTWCGIESNGTNYVTWCGLSGAPSSGVTAGSYTTANITVGVDGRVTSASSGTSASTTTVINNTPVTCDANGACGTSETALQTITIAANTLTASNVLNFTGYGVVTASGSPNLTLRFYGGASGTVLLGSFVWSSSVQTNAGWNFSIDISCGAPGASVACEVQGNGGDPVSTAPQMFPVSIPNTATINLPTNGSQTFRVTAQWTGTTVGNTVTSRLLIGRVQ